MGVELLRGRGCLRVKGLRVLGPWLSGFQCLGPFGFEGRLSGFRVFEFKSKCLKGPYSLPTELSDTGGDSLWFPSALINV